MRFARKCVTFKLMEINSRKTIQKIVKKYALDLLLLFGSRAVGTAHGKSDFDIAYLSRKNLTLQMEANLINGLTPVFKSENIDLVNLKMANPLLFYAIFQNCQTLYAKDDLIFPRQRAYAFKQYIETKPLYELKFKRLKEKIAA